MTPDDIYAMCRTEVVIVESQLGVEDAIRQCKCGYGPLYIHYSYCPVCGRNIKWI